MHLSIEIFLLNLKVPNWHFKTIFYVVANCDRFRPLEVAICDFKFVTSWHAGVTPDSGFVRFVRVKTKKPIPVFIIAPDGFS